jgi:transcription initiation factor TFIIB
MSHLGICIRCNEATMKEYSSAGEWCCNRCGYVAPYPVVDDTSEYRQFAVEHGVKNKPRAEFVGDDMIEDLDTAIAYDGSRKTKRLSDIHRRCTTDPARERLAKHVKAIRKLCAAMAVDRGIADRACRLYREAADAGAVAKKKGDVVDAACVYHACRLAHRNLEQSHFLRAGAFSARDLASAVDALANLKSVAGADTGDQYFVRQYIPLLALPPAVEAAAVAVATIVFEKGVCESKLPQGICGAVIAWVLAQCIDRSLYRSTQKISEVVGPRPETIEKRLVEISVLAPMFNAIPEVQALKRGE